MALVANVDILTSQPDEYGNRVTFELDSGGDTSQIYLDVLDGRSSAFVKVADLKAVLVGASALSTDDAEPKTEEVEVQGLDDVRVGDVVTEAETPSQYPKVRRRVESLPPPGDEVEEVEVRAISALKVGDVIYRQDSSNYYPAVRRAVTPIQLPTGPGRYLTRDGRTVELKADGQWTMHGVDLTAEAVKGLAPLDALLTVSDLKRQANAEGYRLEAVLGPGYLKQYVQTGGRSSAFI